jgi:predicted RNA-binding Zn-ribbon protein involved in translation (DUF1610 family)
MLKFLEDIKDSGESEYRIYCKTGFNPSLENGKIIKYRDNNFKCPDCGRIVFFLLADGSKACFKCWKPEHETFYIKQAELKEIEPCSLVYIKPPIRPKKNKLIYFDAEECFYIYDVYNKKVKCKYCGGDLFVRAYDFDEICYNCGLKPKIYPCEDTTRNKPGQQCKTIEVD